jgi:uncharacterized protein with GYD domain
VESNNQTVPPGSLQEQNETPRDLIMIAGGTPAFRGYRMTKPVSVRAGQAEFAKVTADELTSEGAFCAHANLTILFQANPSPKERFIMAMYISLIQFTDQGIRNVKDTVKRGEAAIAEAEKMGMKITEEFWTMGAYDVVALFEAPDDATMSAFTLKIGSIGNVKSQTLRAFRREEMEKILAKIK